MKEELKKLDALTNKMLETKALSLYLINELMRIDDELRTNKKAHFHAHALKPLLRSCGFTIDDDGTYLVATPAKSYSREGVFDKYDVTNVYKIVAEMQAYIIANILAEKAKQKSKGDNHE